MKLKPGFTYTFLRTHVSDRVRALAAGENYYGEVLSDSWGSGTHIENLMWDEDLNSIDFWQYENVYPELLENVNKCIADGYVIHVCESSGEHIRYDHEIREGKITL
jgi:hypothetical protein